MTSILLVADTTWVDNQVRAALNTGEWKVDTATDPDSAVEMAVGQIPDVVLIDMQVGSMGGMAIVRAIRDAFVGLPRPRMVLLLDREADRFLARRAGADAWVLKPFTAAGLRSALS